jgi:RIO kinase 1
MIDAAGNNNAEWMFARDLNNMTSYYGQFAPELLETNYAKEIWALYENGELTPEVELTGHFAESTEAADVDVVMQEIKAAFAEEQERQRRLREAQEPD